MGKVRSLHAVHGESTGLLRRNRSDNSQLEVDVNQVAEAINADSHILLDVREHDEWDEARIEGSLHIPMSQLMERLGELSTEKPLHIMCHSGVRSLYAVQYLTQAGHTDPKSLSGGIVAWVQAGKPIVH